MCLTRSARNLPFWSIASSASVTVSRACWSRQEGFRARRHPGDRPAGELRGDQQARIFRIARGLQSERAADILGDDAHLLARQSHHGDELVALRAGALRAGAQRVVIARRVVARGRAARLHRVDDEALVDRRDARHMRGAGEDRLDLARIACRRPAPDRASRSRRCPAPRGRAAAHPAQAPRARRRRRPAPRSRPRPARRRPAPARRSRRPPARPAGPTCITRSRASAGTERHDQLGAVAADERRMQRGRADAGGVELLVGQHRHDARRGARRRDVDRR